MRPTSRPAPVPPATSATPADLIDADVLERIPDAFVALDPQWRFCYVNAEAVRLLGRPRRELLGRGLWEVYPRAVDMPVQRSLLRAARAGTPITLEHYHPPLATWFEVRAFPSPGGMSLWLRDITERKLAAARSRVEAVQGTEERLRLVAQVTTDVLWDHDLGADELWFSDTFSAAFGYGVDAIPGDLTTFLELIHPEDRVTLLATSREAADRGLPSWRTEMRLRRADDTFAYVLNRARILYRGGRAVRAVGTLVDLTPQKRAEERQRFLGEATALLASSMDYGSRLALLARLAVPTLGDVCVVDVLGEDGSVQRVEVTTAVAGREGLVRALHHYPPRRAGRSGVGQVLKSGEPVLERQVEEAELRLVAEGPEHLEVLRDLGIRSAMMLPLRARDRTLGALTFLSLGSRALGPEDLELAGELAGRAALAIDNARLFRDAQQASRAKSDFLSVMSHELRTPLSAVLGYAELVLSGVPGELSAAQRRYIERLQLSGTQLLRLVEEILDFSRIDAGAPNIQPRACDAAEVAREAAVAVELLAGGRSLSLDLHLDGPLPLRTDPDRLRQVLVNLLTNAVKYTDQGGVELTGAADGEGGVVLWVRDTGLGIRPEDRSRIFDAFWQADQSSTRRVGGLGLGLAVVRRLVHLLGGEISVESEPGHGSTFELRLPAEAPVEAAPAP
ncbi:MAG TPA: ATP-binding protein [Longimicrobiales bacterium]|nr:ATP-binding protein [Longimicrobiales bacterium]